LSTPSTPERAHRLGTTVAIALGSNLDDRRAHLDHAVTALRTGMERLRVSRYHETAPVGVAPQPPFLNAAAVGAWDAGARDLLEWLLAIEQSRGRDRPHAGAPRTLDLDLILFGDLVGEEPGLRVPHPRFRDRWFVLAPLAEIAPELVDPETGLTVEALLARLPAG
jgi:2-amino-4-hydroxy-6-hydroxymethyldihydropteridine diphosphokinase